MHVYDVLKRPVVTEKSTGLSALGKYVFEVDRRANKMQVKDAVETAFKVTVEDVCIINVPAKMGRYGRHLVVKKAASKKAVVTLVAGNTIEFFEGV